MPDLPINNVMLPANTEERIKWLTYLQGGGLSLFIAVIGLGFCSVLFYTLMDDRSEDRKDIKEEAKISREEDKEFRKQMLEATIDHTTAAVLQTSVQNQTNEALKETKDAIIVMSERFEDVAAEIKELSENEQHTSQRLDRILEKAWNDVRPKTDPVEPPK